MKKNRKGRRASHVIVIAGASGSGKTELIRKLSRPPHDAFTLNILKQLGCDPSQRLKRSTVERMQRLMDPDNYNKRKTRKLKHCLLLHIDLTSVNHNNNMKLLRGISKGTNQLKVITLYTSPPEWRQRIYERMHTENEPSMRAALIALSGRLNKHISNFLYHREYNKWISDLNHVSHQESIMVNTFQEDILTEIPPQALKREKSQPRNIRRPSPAGQARKAAIRRRNKPEGNP